MELRYKKQKVSGGGSSQNLTAGDGTNIKNNAINVNAPFRGVMSEAEYEALPAEKKATGFAFIPEGSDYGGVYSTEEVRIGTWIDGKPLYRKCYQTQLGDTKNKDSTLFKLEDYMEPVRLYGYAKGPSVFFPLPYAGYDGNVASIFVRTNTMTAVSVINYDGWANYSATIIFEYTKTTDEEVSE